MLKNPEFLLSEIEKIFEEKGWGIRNKMISKWNHTVVCRSNFLSVYGDDAIVLPPSTEINHAKVSFSLSPISKI